MNEVCSAVARWGYLNEMRMGYTMGMGIEGEGKKEEKNPPMSACWIRRAAM